MAETEIREAVAGEMEELLRDMEGSYKVTFPIPCCFIPPMRKATISFGNIGKDHLWNGTVCESDNLRWLLPHLAAEFCRSDLHRRPLSSRGDLRGEQKLAVARASQAAEHLQTRLLCHVSLSLLASAAASIFAMCVLPYSRATSKMSYESDKCLPCRLANSLVKQAF